MLFTSKRTFVILILSFGFSVNVQAVLLNMELGVTQSQGADLLNNINPNYGGFTWDDGFVVANTDALNFDFNNTSFAAPSGDNFLFNHVGQETLWVDTGGLINLQSAYFSGFVSNDMYDSFYSSSIVTIEGYLNGILQDTITFDLNGSFDYYSIGMSNINGFNIVNHGGYGVWFMDDLRFNRIYDTPYPLPDRPRPYPYLPNYRSANAVIEPPTLALLGMGLVGLALARRGKNELTYRE